MDITIPAGHVLRAPTAADAGAVAELLRAREAADLGEPEMTVADVKAEWAAPEIELEQDAQVVEAANTAARALLLDAGWWPVHHYFRMLIALKDAPPPPRVLVRTFEERDTEQVWHLVQGAYAGVEGHLPQSLEGWRASALDKPGWDPELALLLHDANGILGVAIGEQGDTGQKRFGFINTLAVAHRARGQGHGRTLLLLLFDAFRRRRLR